MFCYIGYSQALYFICYLGYKSILKINRKRLCWLSKKKKKRLNARKRPLQKPKSHMDVPRVTEIQQLLDNKLRKATKIRNRYNQVPHLTHIPVRRPNNGIYSLHTNTVGESLIKLKQNAVQYKASDCQNNILLDSLDTLVLLFKTRNLIIIKKSVHWKIVAYEMRNNSYNQKAGS